MIESGSYIYKLRVFEMKTVMYTINFYIFAENLENILKLLSFSENQNTPTIFHFESVENFPDIALNDKVDQKQWTGMWPVVYFIFMRSKCS